MSRSWGLPALVLLSLLAVLAPCAATQFLWDRIDPSPAIQRWLFISSLLPFLWIPLMGIAISRYGRRAGWMLIAAPFAFLSPLSWMPLMMLGLFTGAPTGTTFFMAP